MSRCPPLTAKSRGWLLRARRKAWPWLPTSRPRAAGVCSARGRRRRARVCTSASCYGRASLPNRWPLITFAAALATGDALLEGGGVQTDIKWPNDLLANERKICGILAEAIETPAGRAVVAGIGINLTNDAFPPELLDVATSVAHESGHAEREAILAALLSALARWYALLHEPDGAEKIVAAWSSRSSYAADKLIRVTNGDEVLQGVTRGVDSDGALRLETPQGIQLIRAGDVTSVRPARMNV